MTNVNPKSRTIYMPPPRVRYVGGLQKVVLRADTYGNLVGEPVLDNRPLVHGSRIGVYRSGDMLPASVQRIGHGTGKFFLQYDNGETGELTSKVWASWIDTGPRLGDE